MFVDWSNNRMQGNGKFHYPDGTVFEGIFDADKKHGLAVIRYSNKNVYTGDVSHDVLMGGTFYLAELQTSFNIQLQFNNREEDWLNGERVYDAALVQQRPSRGGTSCIIWAQGRFCFGTFLTFEKLPGKSSATAAASASTSTAAAARFSSRGEAKTNVKAINVSHAAAAVTTIEAVAAETNIDLDNCSDVVDYNSDYTDDSVDMRSV